MSAVLPKPLAGAEAVPWLIAALGFAAMYLPSYWTAAHGIWNSEDFGHGPIVLAVAVWLFWSVRAKLAAAPVEPSPALGWSLLALGVFFYLFGRAFGISSAEFLSQPIVVASLLLLLRGAGAFRAAWFPVLYLIFMVPLPGTLVDLLTGPLKQGISVVVTEFMHALGYPIARSGVMITIGQYQLLVADACSGLHSLFSLSALGTLFMYIMGRQNRWHNAWMLASIIPIALISNGVRVIVLVLVTYHFGDEAGQGFVHGAAGMVLMLVALVFFFALDALLARLMPDEPASRTAVRLGV